MLKINKYVTPSHGQWEIVIEGMRNPLNSWDKSDSFWDQTSVYDNFVIGDNDANLLLKLSRAGTDHAKFRRMLPVHITITAPLYWWKEFDTYKVGTVANSCSTMHTIHKKPFTPDDFSGEYLTGEIFGDILDDLNFHRAMYLDTGDRDHWHSLIQLLPSSYNQKRTVSLNYEVLSNIYRARRNHKLAEWHTLCEWIECLPYSELITGGDNS